MKKSTIVALISIVAIANPVLADSGSNSPTVLVHHAVSKRHGVATHRASPNSETARSLAQREADVAAREKAVSQQETALAHSPGPQASSEGNTPGGAVAQSPSAQDASRHSGGPLGFLRRKFGRTEENTTAGAPTQGVQAKQMPSDTGSATTIKPTQPDRLATWSPTIDRQGVDEVKFQRDLADCHAYALQAPGTNGRKEGVRTAKKFGLITVAGTGLLVVATGGLAAIPLAAGGIAAEGGGMAAVTGATSKHEADRKYKAVISTCLSGRSYKVFE